MRWLWIQKTQPDNPLTNIQIKVPNQVRAIFMISTSTTVGDGANTLFWVDNWVHGKSMAELVPLGMPFVRRRGWRRRTVQQALTDNSWMQDIVGDLPVPAIHQVMQLLDIISQTVLQEQTDEHWWTPRASGVFTTKSAYERFFVGGIDFQPYRRLWKTWAPLKIKIFIWLALWNRCWTADRLAKSGLDHPERCLLCDQREEDINHLLLGCSFSRDIWFQVLNGFGYPQLAPTPNDVVFADWWRRAHNRAGRQIRKGINSLIQLVAWSIWKVRNRCVFDGAQPNSQRLVQEIREEAATWVIAGARRLGQIVA